MTAVQISDNVARVRERIAQAASRAGRDAGLITLVAVTKRVEPGRIAEAQRAGITDFGESYVQEALRKMDLPAVAGSPSRWHFIGHLQTNKVRDIAGRFVLIESVDSERLAREIGRQSELLNRVTPVLAEVKLDAAATKFGVSPGDVLRFAEALCGITGIELRGLMGMAPYSENAEYSRPAFRALRAVFDTLPTSARRVLSMGMSRDFEVGVEEGATIVRVGTAIFGERTG
jgi:pyridoxal phosphate enzyme (YggS family)